MKTLLSSKLNQVYFEMFLEKVNLEMKKKNNTNNNLEVKKRTTQRHTES